MITETHNINLDEIKDKLKKDIKTFDLKYKEYSIKKNDGIILEYSLSNPQYKIISRIIRIIISILIISLITYKYKLAPIKNDFEFSLQISVLIFLTFIIYCVISVIKNMILSIINLFSIRKSLLQEVDNIKDLEEMDLFIRKISHHINGYDSYLYETNSDYVNLYTNMKILDVIQKYHILNIGILYRAKNDLLCSTITINYALDNGNVKSKDFECIVVENVDIIVPKLIINTFSRVEYLIPYKK